MQFEYPSQRFQDWLSQRWVMMRGRQVDPNEVAWLMGPFGEADVIGDVHIERLAARENLLIERHTSRAGLVESAAEFGIVPPAAAIAREVADFYERTADYDLEVWSEWRPLFAPFGRLIQMLYSRRLQQLDLPQRPLDTSRGITSEIVQLREKDTGRVRYTIWHRRLKATGRVLYSGCYATCRIPDGRICEKVVFPLPRGNATVMMSMQTDERGALELKSSGEKFGDPGFYFLLRDKKGRHWAQYIRSFRERIFVFVDDEGVLRADHGLTLFRRPVLNLHYKMFERRSDRAGESGAQEARDRPAAVSDGAHPHSGQGELSVAERS